MSHTVSRRQVLQGMAMLAPAAIVPRRQGRASQTDRPGPLDSSVLPRGIRARLVENVNGIRMHVLEAGFDPETAAPGGARARRPAVLLVHGFPELAYSWRKVMLPIAAAGYRVIAPDLRGYGRTDG